MRRKHEYSENHKVVAGPHNFSESHAQHESAESAGGGAHDPQGQMVSDPDNDGDMHMANGGKCYADGGDILGGGVRGKIADYGSAIKQTASDMFGGKSSASKNPVASGNSDEKYEGAGGAARNKSIDDAVKDAGG